MTRQKPTISSRLRRRDSYSPKPVVTSKQELVDNLNVEETSFSPRNDTNIYLDEIQTPVSFVRGSKKEKEQVLSEEVEKLSRSLGKSRTRSSTFYKSNIVPPIPSKRTHHKADPKPVLKALPTSFIIKKRLNTHTKNDRGKTFFSPSSSPAPSFTPSPIIPSSPCLSPSPSNHNPSSPNKFEFPTPRKIPSLSEEEKKRRRRVKREHELRRLKGYSNTEIPDIDAPRATRSRNHPTSTRRMSHSPSRKRTSLSPSPVHSKKPVTRKPTKYRIGMPSSSKKNDVNADNDLSDSSTSSKSSHSSNSSTSSYSSNKSNSSNLSSSSNSSTSSDSKLSISTKASSTIGFVNDSVDSNVSDITDSDDSGSEFSDSSFDADEVPSYRKRPSLRSTSSKRNLDTKHNRLESRPDSLDSESSESKPIKRKRGRPRKKPKITSLSLEWKPSDTMGSTLAKKVTFSSPIVVNVVPERADVNTLSAVIRPSVIPIPLVSALPENTKMDNKDKADEYCRRQRRLFVHSRFVDDDEAVLVALSVYSNQFIGPNDKLVQMLQKNFSKYRVKLQRIFDDLARILDVSKKTMTKEDRMLKLLISDQMTERVLKSVWDYWIEDPYIDEDEFYECEASVSLLKEVTVQAVICHYKEKYELISASEYAEEMKRLDRITRALNLPECEENDVQES